jgi:hypothetical protein
MSAAFWVCAVVTALSALVSDEDASPMDGSASSGSRRRAPDARSRTHQRCARICVGSLGRVRHRGGHKELVGRGIDVVDVWHDPPFPVEARQPGRDPEGASYGSFCSFSDPDGNTWLVQEVTTRLPGRV